MPINLIPQDEFETSSFGRILKWALSTFRIMVIVTELIVMSAFLSRFWLDAKNSDLNESLEISKAQIEAYREVETEFRLRQKQVEILRPLYNDLSKFEVFSNVSKLLPVNVILSSISIKDGDSLQIKAFSPDEKSLGQFLANLSDYKEIDDINLTQISSIPDNPKLTLYTIGAKMKGQPLAVNN